MIIGCIVLRFGLVGILSAEADVIAHIVGAIGGGETEIIAVLVCGIIVHPHRAAVGVLVKPALPVRYGETVVNEYLVIRVLSPHFEAVSVALTRELLKGDGNRLSVAVCHLCSHFGVKPCFVGSQRTRVLGHVVESRSVLVADAVLDDGVR